MEGRIENMLDNAGETPLYYDEVVAASRREVAGPKSSWQKYLTEAFRVDFSKDTVRSNIASLCEENISMSSDPNKPMGFNNTITEGEVRQWYMSAGEEDKADKVILVLKLGLALLAYGHSTIDSEIILRDVCRSLELSVATLDLGMRHVQASFGHGPTHLLWCRHGVEGDKLVATTCLAKQVALGNFNVCAANVTLNQIIERPGPYGWGVQVVALQCFGMSASVVAFLGDYEDLRAVTVIMPFVCLVVKLCEQSRLLQRLEDVLVPLTIGLVTPLVWKSLQPLESCRIPIWFLSCLLNFLPGSRLILGPYEIGFGSATTGSARLVAALVRCMVLVIGLVVGWLPFGYKAMPLVPELNQPSIISSLPPVVPCGGNIPWLLVMGAYSPCLFMTLMVRLELRLRDLPVRMFYGYVSLLVYYAVLNAKAFGGPDLPPLAINVLASFVIGNLGSIHEYYTDTPACLSVLPVIIVFAPGSGVIKSVIAGVHASLNDPAITHFQANLWADLIMQGASYAVGSYVAVVIWRPLHRRQYRRKYFVPRDRALELSLRQASK